MRPTRNSFCGAARLSTAAAVLAFATPASADGPARAAPVVVQYEAPAECPSAEAFAASVRSELTARRWDRAQPLQVHVVVAPSDRGYTVTLSGANEEGEPLERTMASPDCGEATDIAAAVIAIAQIDAQSPDVVVVPNPPSQRTAREAPPGSAVTPWWAGDYAFSFALGYGAFTEGPSNPVVRGYDQQTTFNPAQGVRLGFDVTRNIGGWKPSLHVSAAYFRQSTTTSSVPPSSPMPLMTASSTNEVTLDDREVLLGTVDACPLEIDYAFLALIPCGTFSIMESRGNSGNNPGNETGWGGTAHLRGRFGRFFGEVLGSGVAVSSSYEPPSRPFRLFYALSLGVTFR